MGSERRRHCGWLRGQIGPEIALRGRRAEFAIQPASARFRRSPRKYPDRRTSLPAARRMSPSGRPKRRPGRGPSLRRRTGLRGLPEAAVAENLLVATPCGGSMKSVTFIYLNLSLRRSAEGRAARGRMREISIVAANHRSTGVNLVVAFTVRDFRIGMPSEPRTICPRA